ncbi:MAG: hypothetical protein IJT49_10340 [Clostridia bacterium]|nr:hypothetical protein [Clostridia bacterium]
MKKILAIAIVAVMAVALCVSASAALNIDKLGVNDNTYPGTGNFKDAETLEVNAGDKLYILGWAYGEASNLKEIVYALDDGADVACPDNYRDRADVAAAFGLDESFGVHAGFGHDNEEEGGLLELTGAAAKAGTFVLHIKAVYNDGTSETRDYNLVVSGEAAPAEVSADQWLPGDEPAANAPTWWFNPLSDPDDRYITVNFKAEGSFSGIQGFYYCSTDGDAASFKVELIKDGATVAEKIEKVDGDKYYVTDFGKSFGAGTYSIKYTAATGSNVANDTWFVLGGCDVAAEDVTVEHNVTCSGETFCPSIMLIGAAGGSSQPSQPSNPATADAAVIAIAAVAVVALAGVVVAKKVR